MTQIKCPNCGKIVKDCIYLLLPTACRYELRSGYIAGVRIYPRTEFHSPKHAIGYICAGCDEIFPTRFNKRIAEYLKARKVFNQLKK